MGGFEDAARKHLLAREHSGVGISSWKGNPLMYPGVAFDEGVIPESRTAQFYQATDAAAHPELASKGHTS